MSEKNAGTYYNVDCLRIQWKLVKKKETIFDTLLKGILKTGEERMEQKNTVFGSGVLKKSARELAVFVDEDGNTWICDKDAAEKIDRSRPFSEQNIERCQVMPFDHGG